MTHILYRFFGLMATLLILQGTQLHAQELWKPWYVTPRSNGQHIDLNGKWQLTYRDRQIADVKELKSDEGFQTNIPSSVHWSLYNGGKLPHPYYNKNSELYNWVDEKVWYYTRKVKMEMPKVESYIYLCFDGLDYFSKVWINGQLLGTHEGMFGGPTVEVSKYLTYGEENTITVEVRAGNWGNKATPFDLLPRTETGDRDFTGRQGYNSRASGRIIKPWIISGGSGAEMFFSVGMWQSVRMEILPKIHLERPYLTTASVTPGKATLNLSVEVLANINQLEEVLYPDSNVEVRHPGDAGYVFRPIEGKTSIVVDLYDGNRKALSEEFQVEVFKGRNWIDRRLEVANPKLWNPVGLGSPHLYRVHIRLKRNGFVSDVTSFDYGIRTIERLPSSGPKLADHWQNWQFVVNGRKLFVKGMNFTPQDVLLETDVEKYRWTLRAARNMGVQLIRVWGGGLLETEQFYRLCDELGLMVWQDFPIGNQETPDYPHKVWEAQVVQNICRLRNHASLVLWCGGNEFNPYVSGNTASIGIIERNLQIFDPSRSFVRATPDGGSIHVYPDMDPTWFGKSYRFEPWISETGTHSMPEARMLKEVIANGELNDAGRMWEKDFSSTNPDFVHHFAEYGPARVPRMVNRASHIVDMKNPTIESIAEATQLGAAEFYQVLSDQAQGNYPITTGLMPWLFKRHWPVIGIQFMDWFGQPNIPYYFLKRTYEPRHVALDLDRLLWAPGETLNLPLKVVNATAGLPRAKVSVTVMDDAFQSLYHRIREIKVVSGPSVGKHDFPPFRIPSDYGDRFLFVLVELHDAQGKLLSRSFYYPRSLKKMEDKAFYASYLKGPTAWPALDKGPWLKPTVAKTKTFLSVSGITETRIDTNKSLIKLTIANQGSIPAFLVDVDIDGSKRTAIASDNYFLAATWRAERSPGRGELEGKIEGKGY